MSLLLTIHLQLLSLSISFYVSLRERERETLAVLTPFSYYLLPQDIDRNSVYRFDVFPLYIIQVLSSSKITRRDPLVISSASSEVQQRSCLRKTRTSIVPSGKGNSVDAIIRTKRWMGH